MIFSKYGQLIIDGRIRINDGIRLAEMEAIAQSYQCIQRQDKSREYLYYTIGPFKDRGYLLEVKVHYLFSEFTYIFFTTLDDSTESRKIPDEAEVTYYRNNCYIEQLAGDAGGK